jgi:hypothetical protein
MSKYFYRLLIAQVQGSRIRKCLTHVSFQHYSCIHTPFPILLFFITLAFTHVSHSKHNIRKSLSSATLSSENDTTKYHESPLLPPPHLHDTTLPQITEGNIHVPPPPTLASQQQSVSHHIPLRPSRLRVLETKRTSLLASRDCKTKDSKRHSHSSTRRSE